MKDLGSKDKQIMLDMIKTGDFQERCSARGDGQVRQMIFFCSMKNMHEQDETRFAKARISYVVIAIEEHDNDSLRKHVSHEGDKSGSILERLWRNKWQEFDTVWRNEPRETSESKIMSTGPSDRQDHNIVHGA